MKYDAQHEAVKTPRPKVKFLKNVWLISIPVFVVSVLLFRFFGFESNPLRTFSLILMGVSSLVGGLSFLIWISILIFSNKPLRIVDIFLGIIFALLFALTVRNIVYMYVYDHGLGDGLYDFLSFLLAFGAFCFAWIKTRKILSKSIIVLVLIGTYFLGRVYAVREYQSFKDAMSIFTQANSDQGYAWTKETDPVKYMDGQRKYVASLKLAFDTAKSSLRWGKSYFENYYLVKKDLLDYDEKLDSHEIVLTNEQSQKIIDESNSKMKALDQQGYMLPFWTDFFRVKP